MLLLDYWLHSGVIVRLAVCFIFSIKLQRPWRLTKGNAEMINMSKKTWKLRVWGHMTEMQKLDYLLTKAGITHEMERRFPENDKNRPEVCGPGALHDGGYQITVRDKSGTYLWDAVCGWYTYGFPHLLEVCGLALVDHYDVEGWLTARQVMKMWGRRNAAKNR